LREQWCDEHEDTFTEQKLDEFWFCDEIVVEEGGHPKGVDPKCVHLLFNVATLAVSSKCKCSHNIVRPYTLARKESALKHTISAYKLVGGLAALNVQNAPVGAGKYASSKLAWHSLSRGPSAIPYQVPDCSGLAVY
jgi:hypothetical protein